MRDDALILHIEFCSILNILIINLVSVPHCSRQLVRIPILLATLNSFATLNKSPKVMDPFQIKDIVMHTHARPLRHLKLHPTTLEWFNFNRKRMSVSHLFMVFRFI